MQGKHRFMVSRAHAPIPPRRADAFLEDMRGRVTRLRALTTRRDRAAAVLLVTRPEPVVLAETVRYAAALAEMHRTRPRSGD